MMGQSLLPSINSFCLKNSYFSKENQIRYYESRAKVFNFVISTLYNKKWILILEVIVLERLVNDMDPSDKEFLNQILWIN